MKNHADFYATSATVIPIFFLLFAVQNTDVLRVKITQRQKTSDMLWGMAVTVILLTLAEAAALAGLLGMNNMLNLQLIVWSIGLSVEQIVFGYLAGQSKKLLEEMKTDEEYLNNAFSRLYVRHVIWTTRSAMVLPLLITFTASTALFYMGGKLQEMARRTNLSLALVETNRS
jgi:predicted CDP-diglyceride synthetase/phosphatidate cytidylyltransferase